MDTGTRYVHALYCDDIREEVGGKYSLIGMYGSDLVIQSPGIVSLPKLCVVARVVTAIHHPFRELRVQVLRDAGDQQEEVISTGAITLPEVRDFPADARTVDMQVMLVMAPFAVAGDCLLRVRALTESGVLEGQALRIRHVAEAAGGQPTRH